METHLKLHATQLKHQLQSYYSTSKRCELLLAAHEIQIVNINTMKPKYFQWTLILNFMLLNLNN